MRKIDRLLNDTPAPRRVSWGKWGTTIAGGIAAAGLVVGLAGTATPALADPPPGASVGGSVSVSSTLALSFDSTSFAIATSPGATTSSNTLTATIQSNSGTGYALTEQLASTGFSGPGSASIPVSAFKTTKYMQPGMSNNFGYVALPGSADTALTVASNTGPSAAAGDTYGLSWQVATPGNQASGTYTATDNFVLLGS